MEETFAASGFRAAGFPLVMAADRTADGDEGLEAFALFCLAGGAAFRGAGFGAVLLAVWGAGFRACFGAAFGAAFRAGFTGALGRGAGREAALGELLTVDPGFGLDLGRAAGRDGTARFPAIFLERAAGAFLPLFLTVAAAFFPLAAGIQPSL